MMDDKLLFMLSKAESKLTNYIKNKFSEQNLNISPGQLGILFLLKSHNSRPMTELSSILEIDNSAITRLVDRLEKSGYVKRQMNTDDRRQYLIIITEEGKQIAEKAKIIVKETNNKLKEGFSENEIEIFKKIITSFDAKFK